MAHELPRLADAAEAKMARVDQELHDEFGADESKWTSPQRRQYFRDLDAARIEAGWVAA